MFGLVRQTQTNQYSNPKTALSFFAIVLGIIATFAVSAAGVLASNDDTRHLAVYPLAFFALFSAGVVIAVFWTLLKGDASKLQVTELSGTEFIEYQRLTLGDSISGESTEDVMVARTVIPTTEPVHGLPPGRDQEGA